MTGVLCALIGLGAPAATATGTPLRADTGAVGAVGAVVGDAVGSGGSGEPGDPGEAGGAGERGPVHPPAPGPGSASAEVARLYAEAARTSAAYERNRVTADVQRQQAAQAQELLAVERERARALSREVGRLAREHYRAGGGLPHAARMLLAPDPAELLRDRHVAKHAQLTLDNAVARSRGAQRRLERTERAAADAQRALDRRLAALDGLKRQLRQQLAEARGHLQGEADEAVATGDCPGATRLDVPQDPVAEPWVAPVDTYRLSAGFDSAGAHWSHRHTGQDFAVPIGTPVRAAGEGEVVGVSCGGGFGMQVVLAHPDGYFTQYAHLAAPAVEPGERVRTGQWIGQSGSSGNSTGPHLHFEVRLTESMGSAVDPVPWLAERGVRIVQVSGDPEEESGS